MVTRDENTMFETREAPQNWNQKRLKFLIKTNPIPPKNHLSLDALVSFIPMEAVGEYGGLNLEIEKPLEEIGTGYTYFADNDVVVAKITPCFENYKGALAVGLKNSTAFGTTELHVLRSLGQIDPKFLFYLSMSTWFRSLGEAQMYGAGGQKRVPDEFIKNLLVVYPTMLQQTKIVSFLDAKTAQIDALIAKKQRLLTLLAEKRSALITQAVTKGLNPNAPMKPSGVEWLGDIPEHWEVVPLFKYLESLVDYRGKTPEKTESGIFLVTVKNIKNGNIDYAISSEYISESDYQEVMSRGLPQLGDVLFTTEAPLGEVANIDNIEIALAQRVLKLRGLKGILDNYYLKYWMMNLKFKNSLFALATGSTAVGLKAAKKCYVKLALPPIQEQLEIISQIKEIIRVHNKIDSRLKEAIDRLKEYRAALITAAVTGNLKVA